MGFPVNIAAGALVAILAGMVMRRFGVQNHIGWYMFGFFLFGTVLALGLRNQEWVATKWNNFMCWLGQ